MDPGFWEVLIRFIYGAPAMVPLLFPNLAVLALLGLAALIRRAADVASD
ncbi:MAG: hypothetical protein O3A51_06860 [Verrucomicrobia bacterium]|nr:hypothetical protein [Verrucomicrobiota bacterium]